MWRKIVIALIVLLLLGGYLIWSNKKEARQKEIEKASKKVVKLDFDKLKKIIIKRPDSTVVLEKKKDYWWVVSPVKDYADKFAVNNILDAFRDREYEKIVYKNAKDLSIFALENPRYEITFETTDGKKVTIQIGRRLPTSSKIYIKYPGSNTVYLVRTGFLYALSKNINGYRSKRIFKIFYSVPATIGRDIVKIDIKQTGGDSYTLYSENKTEPVPEEVKKAGSKLPGKKVWYISGKIRDLADSGKVSELIKKIQDGNLAEFVKNDPTDRDLAKYGLLSPQKELIVYFNTGEKAVLRVGNPVPKPKHEYYAYVEGYPVIFTIRDYDVRKLFPDVASLRSKKIAEFFADQITGVSVTKFSRSLKMHRTKDWRWVDSKGTEHDPNVVYQFLTGINNQYGSDLLEKPDDKVSVKDLIGSIVLFDKNGKTVVNMKIYQPVKISERGKTVWLYIVDRGVYLKKHSSIDSLIPDNLFKSKQEIQKEEKSNKKDRKGSEKE